MSDEAVNIDLVMRQTNYGPEMAAKKLAEHKGDVMSVLRDYHGIAAPHAQTKTVNQEIYRQIRKNIYVDPEVSLQKGSQA
jgi:hypothetical protein